MSIPSSPLDRTHAALLRDFAPLAGAPLDDVVIQRDELATRVCQAVGAIAVTIGARILVHPAAAALAPLTYRTLLAHEVVHVVQNRRARERRSRMVSHTGDAAEREARALAPLLASGQQVRIVAQPTAILQCKSMDMLKTALDAKVYHEIAVPIRKSEGGDARQHAINFSYALADVYTDLAAHVNEAKPALGSLSTIASFFVTSKLGKSANVLDRNVTAVKQWVDEIKTTGKNKQMSKGDIGRLLLAAARRNWQASQLRKVLDDSAGVIGTGDASWSNVALWMYNFAFYHKGALDLGHMQYNANRQLQVPLGGNAGHRRVWLYQDRVLHIVGGHTFAHYVLDDEAVGNLTRAQGGIQTFFPVSYTDLDVATAVEAAVLNSADVRQRLAANNLGWVNVPAPYHLRLALNPAGQSVKVGTAFPSSQISQPNTHRIPEPILEAIYSLMAQGLGLATLRRARQATNT